MSAWHAAAGIVLGGPGWVAVGYVWRQHADVAEHYRQGVRAGRELAARHFAVTTDVLGAQVSRFGLLNRQRFAAGREALVQRRITPTHEMTRGSSTPPRP